MIETGEFASDAYGPTVGDRLRAAREDQGLALEDIAARTRIPMRHLQMIERGDHAGLPAATYSAGFVKTYARLLGLDGQELSEQFRAEIGSAAVIQHQPAYEPADPRRTPPWGLAALALVAALVLGLGYLYWRGAGEEATELAARNDAPPAVAAPAAAPGAVTPIAVAPGAVAPAQAVPLAGSGPVTIAARGDIWIKVSDGGKTLFLGVLKPGDTYAVPAEAVAPLLTTGRPGMTQITVGSTEIPTVGDPDRAAKDVSLKPADLLARAGVAQQADTLQTAPAPPQ